MRDRGNDLGSCSRESNRQNAKPAKPRGRVIEGCGRNIRSVWRVWRLVLAIAFLGLLAGTAAAQPAVGAQWRIEDQPHADVPFELDLMVEEMKSTFGQIGARKPEEARSVVIRHPGAMHF